VAQLSDVRRDPRASSLVSSLADDRRPWLILEIDIRQLLPSFVLHDKAGFQSNQKSGIGPIS
jgi:hypothetical protein